MHQISACLVVFFLASALSAPVDPAPLDCGTIVSPIDPDSKLPVLDVRNQTDGTCVVECKWHRTAFEICAAFSDGANQILKKAGLAPATCFTSSIESPGEAPGSSNPEMFTTSCPDYFLYVGWDRDQQPTMGNMRQELLLKTKAAVEAIAKGFKQ